MPDTHPHESAIVHLYRGELGRMTTYRVRLDTTTNWALGAVVAVVTFTLGQPRVPHEVLLLPYVLGCVFAGLEARRFQEMAVSNMRLRLLEQGFYQPMLDGKPPREPDWQQQLADSLASPTSPIGFWNALANRAARNYVWLFLALYGAWWGKLALSPQPMMTAASFGGLPGAAVAGLATALVLPWGLMALTRGRRG